MLSSYKPPVIGFIDQIYRLAEDIVVEVLLTKSVYIPVSYPNPFFLRHLPNGEFLGLGMYIQGEPTQNDVRNWVVINLTQDVTTTPWAKMTFTHGYVTHKVELSDSLSARVALLYDCFKLNDSAPSVTCESDSQMASPVP